MINYKMLDYLMVYLKDVLLWQDNDSETLKYITVDELLMFDSVQGTDLRSYIQQKRFEIKYFRPLLFCIDM